MSEQATSRTLREILRTMARRSFGIGVILVVIIAAVWVVTSLSPRWYRSEAQLYARPGQTISPLDRQSAVIGEDVQLFVVTQREIIKSNFVLASALMKLQGKPVQPEPATTEGKSTYQWYTDNDIADFARDNAKPLKKAGQRVSVVTPGGPDSTFTQTFKLRVDWPEEPEVASEKAVDPRELAAKRAHDFAKHVVDAYRLRQTQLETERMTLTSDFMTVETVKAAKNDLDAAIGEMETFVANEIKGDLPVVTSMLPGSGASSDQGISFLATHFQAEINKNEAKLAELEALKKEVDKQRDMEPNKAVVPDAVTAANPPIRTLQDKIVALKLSVNSMAPRYTEDYQELRNARMELAAAYQDLHDQLDKQSVRLAVQIATLQARNKRLKDIQQADGARMQVLAGKAAKYDRLQRTKEAAQSRYDEQKRKSVAADTARRLAETPVLASVLDPPSQPIPSEPRRPVLWLNMLIGIVAAMIVALVYVFLADHLDHSIKSVDDAERYLGTAVLGSIPRTHRRIIRHG
ncbi:MAG TPA: hypothetical protein VNA25_28135 [Phycisphaerae bacterium]|nr:hypothetical protein [Phycisphaerae bacterium]